MTPTHPVTLWALSADERSLVLAITDVSRRQMPDLRAARKPLPASRPADGSDVGRRLGVDDGDGADRWGRSERARAVLRVLLHPLYRYWFRLGFENVDRDPDTRRGDVGGQSRRLGPG
jgi:hypothetical protein